jgi:hypothetical protein
MSEEGLAAKDRTAFQDRRNNINEIWKLVVAAGSTRVANNQSNPD